MHNKNERCRQRRLRYGFLVASGSAVPDLGVSPSIHMTTKHRIFTTSFASVYPYYVAKAEKKGRKKSEVDAVI
jgi:hypothetical protein